MSTVIALPALYFGNEDYAPVSDSSSTIQHKWQRERNYLRSSASDWLPTIDGALSSVRIECRNADWDYEGALPVTDRTIDLAASIAARLFDLLPKGTPAPDVIPESDGEICISWSADAERMFSLSVGEHGKINFTGQFEKEGGIHAWQAINAASEIGLQESLSDVVRYIQRLYPSAAAGSAS